MRQEVQRVSNRYRYAYWDGTQVVPGLDADAVMSAIADDLLNHGDLEHALRSLMQRGIRSPERNMRGLTDYVRQLREERRKRLEQYNLSGVMDDIERQLQEIVQDERSSVDDLRKQAAAEEQAQQQQAKPGARGGRPPKGQKGKQQNSSQSGPERSQQGQQQQQKGDDFASRFSQKLMRDLATDKQRFLDHLPESPAAQVKALQDYEFLSPEAKEKFDKLLEQLRKAVTESFFKDMKQMVQRMSDNRSCQPPIEARKYPVHVAENINGHPHPTYGRCQSDSSVH